MGNELLLKLTDLDKKAPNIVKSYDYIREDIGKVRVELTNRLLLVVDFGDFSEMYFGHIGFEYSMDDKLVDAYIDIECSSIIDESITDPMIPLSKIKKLRWFDLNRTGALYPKH